MNALELRGALRSALDSGMKPDEISELVNDFFDERRNEPPAYFEAGQRVYEISEQPRGAITLGEAARKYGVSRSGIRKWIAKGRISIVGSLRYGGPSRPALVNEAQVAECARALQNEKSAKNKCSKG